MTPIPMMFWRSKKPARIPSEEEIRREIEGFLNIHHPGAAQLLGPHRDFLAELGMDSMDIAELLVHLERTYQIDFVAQETIPPLRDIETLARFTLKCRQDSQKGFVNH